MNFKRKSVIKEIWGYDGIWRYNIWIEFVPLSPPISTSPVLTQKSGLKILNTIGAGAQCVK
jgi:hypothetical protein